MGLGLRVGIRTVLQLSNTLECDLECERLRKMVREQTLREVRRRTIAGHVARLPPRQKHDHTIETAASVAVRSPRCGSVGIL